MHYPGGKGVSGVYQRLINQIPPHRVYIESHLGGGAIMRFKRPTQINIGIDRDPDVLKMWSIPYVQAVCSDAAEFLKTYPFEGGEFVYSDPPYLPSTLRSDRSAYKMGYTEEQHIELLNVLYRLPCKVMISGYWSPLYSDFLKDWRSLNFKVRNRSGTVAEEWVWMNYPEPEELHDYQYLGRNFRERERIRRKIGRWVDRLKSLSYSERSALIERIQKTFSNPLGKEETGHE